MALYRRSGAGNDDYALPLLLAGLVDGRGREGRRQDDNCLTPRDRRARREEHAYRRQRRYDFFKSGGFLHRRNDRGDAGRPWQARYRDRGSSSRSTRPLAGSFAALLFTLGMVGTGVLAVPVLAGSSAYVAAQTFKFREGLGERPQRAPRFYGILTAGTLIGIGMNLLHVDAIKVLFLGGSSKRCSRRSVDCGYRIVRLKRIAHGIVEKLEAGKGLGLGDGGAHGGGNRGHVLFHGEGVIISFRQEAAEGRGKRSARQ